MGQDWCRMRLKEGVDLGTVRWLIDAQAIAWSQYDDIEYDWAFSQWAGFDMFETFQREQARQAYAQASNELEKYLHIPVFAARDDEDKQPAEEDDVRIYGISRNHIFPRELRVRAFRSYLPDELAPQVAEWKGFIDGIHAGEYRAFLLDWYLYLNSHNAKFFWEEMQSYVGLLDQRSNAWVKRLLETSIPEQIRALPEPTTYTRPVWTKDNADADHKTDPRYIELWQTLDRMHTVRREWNRKVPRKMKMGSNYLPFHTETFEKHLRWADYADDLLAWLEQCVANGVGLFFWG